MQIIALDFETYFDSEYELNKMSTESYVRDPRFEPHGCSIKWGPNHEARWYDAKELPFIFANEDWSQYGIIAHHVQFDGLILTHHYGVKPKLWLDTLSMARQLIGTHVSGSLDSVRKHFGMSFKRTPYKLFKGKHWHEMDAYTRDQVADGCNDEVESIWKIFGEFAKEFPAEEYGLVDITMRMFTEPVLQGDTVLLGQIWCDEDRKKSDAIATLGVDQAELHSNDKFTALLSAEGVDIEYKAGKNGLIPCFAKTDDFMQSLLEDENPRVAQLAAARLGEKSTILQSRAEKIGWMATRGPLCIYLRFNGAHTSRWSGGDGTNFQNMPARKKETRRLRQALMAPDGFVMAKPDSSQIECRLLNFIARQEDMIELFRSGGDPYIGQASAFYGETIYKPKKGDPRFLEMETKRGAGKQGELMCGYGCGWQKYQWTAKIGTYGPSIVLSDLDAQRAVEIYRQRHPNVVALWKQGDQVLRAMAAGASFPWGPVEVRCSQGRKRIVLPNGVQLIYDSLEWHVDPDNGDQYWRVKTRQGWAKLYGAKLVENLIQALARVFTGQAMIQINRMGFKIATMSHDDICILIPNNGEAQGNLDRILSIMRTPPAWLPGVPLDAEGSLSVRYGE